MRTCHKLSHDNCDSKPVHDGSEHGEILGHDFNIMARDMVTMAKPREMWPYLSNHQSARWRYHTTQSTMRGAIADREVKYCLPVQHAFCWLKRKRKRRDHKLVRDAYYLH